MFKIGDRVRLISNHKLKGQCGTVTGFVEKLGDTFVKTTIGSGGGWYPSSLELIESVGSVRFVESNPQTWTGSSMPSITYVDSPLSTRCEICSGCDHLTVECPGLHHDIEPVFKERMNGFTSPEQQAAFDARMVAAGQAKPCECERSDTPKPRNCTVCGEPEWSGRCIVGMGGSCGDCLSGGTPLIAQPVKEPERIKYHAGMTETWDWVGDL